MPYWRLYYHLIWATHRRAPLITPVLEPALAHELRAAAHRADLLLHAVGIMPDHVHLAVSIPPAMPVATAVSRLKGATARHLNAHHSTATHFRWQNEYGVVSFGEGNLPAVARYLTNQRARHAADRLWPDLEQIMSEESPDPLS